MVTPAQPAPEYVPAPIQRATTTIIAPTPVQAVPSLPRHYAKTLRLTSDQLVRVLPLSWEHKVNLW